MGKISYSSLRLQRRKLRRIAEAIRTSYWKPGANFLEEIFRSLKNHIDDGDIVTVSEKAISIALGNIVDESSFKAGFTARLIARYWIRYVWGYILSLLCHLREKTIIRLRNYPLEEGGRHKQVAIAYVGLIHALHWGSEGGIDASNLPYSYVCLPIRNPEKIADTIRRWIFKRLNKRVGVIIVDTDKTYSLKSIHITPRRVSVKGIHAIGPIAYIVGRMLRFRRRSTPIAISGVRVSVETALEMAEVANRLRGSGAGMTVWDMAERFGVPLTEVTWEMLEKVEHKPIVIFKLSKLRRFRGG